MASGINSGMDLDSLLFFPLPFHFWLFSEILSETVERNKQGCEVGVQIALGGTLQSVAVRVEEKAMPQLPPQPPKRIRFSSWRSPPSTAVQTGLGFGRLLGREEVEQDLD